MDMEIESMSIDNDGVTSHDCDHDQDQDEERNPRIRAVSLGGWLLAEGRIKPSLFDGIRNNDLLDGTHVRLKSAALGTYLCAESGGGSEIVANRTSADLWETFRLWRINESLFNFRVNNKQFVGINPSGKEVDHLVAVSDSSGRNETFEIVRNSSNPNRVKIKASNGFFLQVSKEGVVTADYREMTSEHEWGDEDDPSVFLLTRTKIPKGEFQVTNGYGPDKAPQVMQEHWRTFIVEEDLKFVANIGLDAVRIPVGWWIASDPHPPPPYVGGSSAYLDAAFSWAEKYGLKVIVDLHAAPSSQNGWDSSSPRDGFPEWGQTDDSIQQTLDVIEFLTSRYVKSSSFYAIDLVSEPVSETLPLETIIKYYKAGYKIVRKHSTTAYVIMSCPFYFYSIEDMISMVAGLDRTVIDVHYYNVFINEFDTAQDNIDFIYKRGATHLNRLTTSDGPLIFVGEWTAEWKVIGAMKEEYQKFTEAQLEVYGRATFGWAYWTLKNANNHWSFEWMIKNGYIRLI